MNLDGPWEVPVANVFSVVAPKMEHQNKREGMCPPYPWAIVAETDPDSVGGEAAAGFARAIAAVPNLVDACRKALSALCEGGDKDEAEKSLRQALVKAGEFQATTK